MGVKKGHRQCQGCFKFFPIEEFPPGCIFCAPDKKAINNLRNIAVRDNGVEWYEEQMACASSRKALLKKYHDKVGDVVKTLKPGARLRQPRVLDLKETVSNSKDTKKSKLGEMMWRGAYVRFRKKRKNTNWTSSAARQSILRPWSTGSMTTP